MITIILKLLKEPTDTVIFHVSNKVNVEEFKKYIDDIISFTYIVTPENDFSVLTTDTGKIKRIVIKDRREGNL